MHYLLLKQQNLFREGGGGELLRKARQQEFSLFLFSRRPRGPAAGSGPDSSRIKGCCSAVGNGRRWGGGFLCSDSGSREAAAYLDQRWAGALAVRAV